MCSAVIPSNGVISTGKDTCADQPEWRVGPRLLAKVE